MSLFVLFVPTFNVFESTIVGVCAHSITLFMRLSLFVSHFGPTHIFVPSTLYTSVIVFVSNFVVCVNCIFVQLCLSAHSMPFCYSVSSCPLSFCQRCLCQIRSVCVQSACIVCAHSRCLCLLSSVSAPTLLLPALCTLSVFVHFISHQDLWAWCYFRHLGHIVTNASCKIFNWTIYQLCRCIL